ncbi:MAG: methyltransferase [Spirochaetaceae bacterium]|nr:MAG: methyltransferase [Spirochaetaceae bacterium]
MTSRERVLAAIAHQEPDRVPVDLGSTPSSGISAIAYTRLMRHMGIQNSKTRVYDVVQELAQPEDHVLDAFDVDVIDIGRAFNIEDDAWYAVELSDGSRAYYPGWFRPQRESDGALSATVNGTVIARKPVGATFFDATHFPYLEGYPESYAQLQRAMGMVHWAALVHSPWDHAADPDFWQTLRRKALQLRETTDKALMIVVGCNLFEWGTFLRRLDNFLMDVYADEQNVQRLLDALVEIHLANLQKVCEAVGDVVDIIRFGDDLGMDSGPFMSPERYRTLFKPHHQRMCQYVQQHSTMHTFLHSCGSIYQLIPDLIDVGFEILNPVQTNTVDMDAERLKREFGSDVTFWGGGADTRHTLNNGSPAAVRNDVKQRIDALAPGGGFVFNTIHNILPDVPPENVVAMFETLKDYGTVNGRTAL